MNKKLPYRIIVFLLFTGLIFETRAQVSSSIKASVDKSKILIGEPLVLTLEASFPATLKTNFFDIDSIAHFEFLKPAQIDSFGEASSKGIKAIYTLTSFDSGHWVIPAFVLSPKVKSDTIPVDVVFSDFNPDQNYHDIKDIIEIKPKKEKDWLWYAIAATVVVLLLIYFLLRKKKQPAKATQPALNAYDNAMKQLNLLQKERLQSKEYYTRLIDIFRLYVLQKKDILSLQKTTDDLVRQLKLVVKEKETYDRLQQSLQLSDFVKFAKYKPTAEDDNMAFNTIKKTIQHIEQLP
jgi:hypothetical protein